MLPLIWMSNISCSQRAMAGQDLVFTHSLYKQRKVQGLGTTEHQLLEFQQSVLCLCRDSALISCSLRKPQGPSRRPFSNWLLHGYYQNKLKSKLDVAESNFILISIYITHRETQEEHINNVLFVAGVSGGEFSAIILTLTYTPAHCSET